MKKLLINDASDPQLAHFAKNVQMIETVPDARGGILAALTESGWVQDYILVDGDVPDDDDAVAQDQFVEAQEQVYRMTETGFADWRGSPMVRLRLLSTDRPGGNEPAHPSINGSPPLIIPRGKLCEIPYDFYLVLKQAGGTKLLPGERPTDDLVKQDYYEYPMTDVVLPDREAIAAWKRKVGSRELGGSVKAAA